MAAGEDFSKDFSIDAGIFTTAKVSLGASTDSDILKAIIANNAFPDGDVVLGHISFTADTGNVSLQPAVVDGASVSFDISGSMTGGTGVFGASAAAVNSLQLVDPPKIQISDAQGRRYLVADWGYSATLTGSASHPVGVLGTVSFGADASRASTFAILHRFGKDDGAHQVIADSLASWRLPRHVALVGGDLNIKPGTWLLAEADGSLALKLAVSLGWNMTFAKDATLLGVTHNLSAAIDASLTATLGFNVSGKYVVVVGREDESKTVRLQLWKESSEGLGFGLNLTVGVQGADPQLPENFNDFISATFGVHGLQVLKDLREWTDPSNDLGQKLAGLTDQTAINLLKSTTGIDPAVEFDKAKKVVSDALDTWSSLPDKLSAMLWNYLDKLAGKDASADFKSFLTDLTNPATAADAVATALQKATFGDTPQGQLLEAAADRGLLALASNLVPVSKAATQVLNILNGGVIAKLQSFINEKLNLDQIRKAITDTDFNTIEQWLQTRLGTFLDKTLELDDLKDFQKAITTLDIKVAGYYATAIQALTKRYSLEFAATYQQATSDTALLDVSFDLSKDAAAQLFAEVVSKSNLDNLLTKEIDGVTLNQATLSHGIKRKGMLDLHMPFFDFTSTHVNDAMITLTAEDQGGRLLLYQIDAEDKVTVTNRTASQLSVFASLKTSAGQAPQLDNNGTIAYEMLQVKASMRPLDLQVRTKPFISDYLESLFSSGDTSIGNFYTIIEKTLSNGSHVQNGDLGDMAMSMQLALPATLLGEWLRPRDKNLLRSDQMAISRGLQVAWRSILPSLFFQDLSSYEFQESVAALLVWSSLPPSTSVESDDSSISKFNTDKDIFWDWPDIDLRRAMARDQHTVRTLVAKLTLLQSQLLAAGSSNASFFDPSKAGRLIDLALNATGDIFYQSLLFTEATLVKGAVDTLAQAAAAVATAALAPAQAIKILAKFAGDLTDTFNNRIDSVYSGVSGRLIGPMLFVETSATLGASDVKPAAMLTLYALNPGHTFDLGTFISGSMPQESQLALTQTIVSLA